MPEHRKPQLSLLDNLGDEILCATQGSVEWHTVGEIAELVAEDRYPCRMTWWRTFWSWVFGKWAFTPTKRAVYHHIVDMPGFFEQRKRQDPSIKGGWDVEYRRIPWPEDEDKFHSVLVVGRPRA
jgi:hypothetical protein